MPVKQVSLIFSGGALALKCRAPGCKRQAKRWIGWNSAPPGETPVNVKAPFCADHTRAAKAMTRSCVDLGGVAKR